MPTVSHSSLTTTDLHEPKGVSTAVDGTVYVADGAGSGSWKTPNPHGSWRYTNIGTGTTFTTPSSPTLMSVAGSLVHGSDFSMPSNGRLRYDGTANIHAHLVCDLSFKHSTGSGQDCYFYFYKNGSLITTGANAIMVSSADAATYQHIAIHADVSMVTNDYVELYLSVSSGNIIVHSAYMFGMGMPD